MAAARAVFIVAAKRTPFGTYGGKLRGVSATDMCRVAVSAALESGKVPAQAVDSVVVGNVAQVGGAAPLILLYTNTTTFEIKNDVTLKSCFNIQVLFLLVGSIAIYVSC